MVTFNKGRRVLILKYGIEAPLHTCIEGEENFMQSLSAFSFLFFGDKTRITFETLTCTFIVWLLNVMLCAIWKHLYNLKNVKNTHGGKLLLGLQLY